MTIENTLEMAYRFGKEHRIILRIIQKYKNRIGKLGPLNKVKKTGYIGRPPEVYNLNTDQIGFIVAVMGNDKKSLDLKVKLVKGVLM